MPHSLMPPAPLALQMCHRHEDWEKFEALLPSVRTRTERGLDNMLMQAEALGGLPADGATKRNPFLESVADTNISDGAKPCARPR